jgi:hypothetical protein
VAYLHAERRKPGVTLELLHLEYLEQHPEGYRYTQFCELYRRWCKRRCFSMRQVHRAGEKCFVDYAGTKPSIIDVATGEVSEVELFVAVLGASNYTYAEATRTQQVADWISSHQRAFHATLAPPRLPARRSRSSRSAKRSSTRNAERPAEISVKGPSGTTSVTEAGKDFSFPSRSWTKTRSSPQLVRRATRSYSVPRSGETDD